MPYWNTPLVGMSGRPFLIGSGMTPGAPEMSWPPPSYIRDMLIARRAPFGQNEALSVMIASFPSANLPSRTLFAPARKDERSSTIDSEFHLGSCLQFRP